jgi:hypothetical protein
MSWSDALSGAGGGAGAGASFGPWGAAIGAGLGLLGGFLGGRRKPKIPRELRNVYKFQMSLADQQRRFAQSTPLSTPEEQNYLGQARGELGEQLTNQREQLGSLYNPLTMGNNAPNQLQNLGNQQIGAQMNLQGQALLNAYQQRRQALSQASGMAANAAGAVSYQQQPQYDMAGTFGGLAHAIAMQRAMSQGQGATPGITDMSQLGMANPGGATTGVAGVPDSEMFSTQAANRTATQPFNPLGQVGALQLPGNWSGVGPSGHEQGAALPGATPLMPMGGMQGSNAGQMGFNFADPRTRHFYG